MHIFKASSTQFGIILISNPGCIILGRVLANTRFWSQNLKPQDSHQSLLLLTVLIGIGLLLLKKTENQKKFFSKKGSSVFTFSVCLSVCVSVCSRPVGHSFWPWGLIFGMNNPQGNTSKYIILFFDILRFDLLMAIFRNFFVFFAIYPVLSSTESVDQTK